VVKTQVLEKQNETFDTTALRVPSSFDSTNQQDKTEKREFLTLPTTGLAPFSSSVNLCIPKSNPLNNEENRKHHAAFNRKSRCCLRWPNTKEFSV
jgi:hypothetical protein